MIVRKAQVYPGRVHRARLPGRFRVGRVPARRHGLRDRRCRRACVESDRLPEPLFTPSTKAEIGDHDENISPARMREIVGEEAGRALEAASLALYTAARDHAARNGIIIADTKFEFGLVDGELTLVDEVLTPDSSRFWPADSYEPGTSQPSFDKQFVRDWLDASAAGTRRRRRRRCPEDVVAATSAKYIEAYERITGRTFEPTGA